MRTTRVPARQVAIGDQSEGCTATATAWDGDVVVIEWTGNDGRGYCTLRYTPDEPVKVTA